MSRPALSKSGRDLVAYFAGHLANLVNGNDVLSEDVAVVELKAFQLYERVQRLLTGNRHYSDVLVGVWAYPAPNDTVDAAEFYFDAVLDRPIARKGNTPSSADNLRALVVERAVGPRPLLDDAALSTWKALVSGNLRVRRFLERQDLFELSNRILKCLDAANRPYAEVLRLGLCPKDWLVGDSAITVNTLKAANAYLSALKVEMRGEFGRRPSEAETAAAWARAPVPGHDDAPSFGRSLFGSAILSRLAGQDHTALVSFDALESTLGGVEARDEGDEPLMTSEEALPLLDRAVVAGVVAADEKSLLAAILDGRPLAEAMRTDLGLRRRLKANFDNDLEAYVEDLSKRVAKFVASAGSRP